LGWAPRRPTVRNRTSARRTRRRSSLRSQRRLVASSIRILAYLIRLFIWFQYDPFFRPRNPAGFDIQKMNKLKLL
jgi:hypothetical protein